MTQGSQDIIQLEPVQTPTGVVYRAVRPRRAVAWQSWFWLAFALLWLFGCSPAGAGAVLICMPPYGCRSSPYFPPIPVPVVPNVVIQAPVGPYRPPAGALAPGPVRGDSALPPPAYGRASPGRGGAMRDAEHAEIEAGILAFCDSNPSENFCIRLLAYLQRYQPGK